MSIINRHLSEANAGRAKSELAFLLGYLDSPRFRGELAIEFRGPSELSVYDRGFRLAQVRFVADGSYRVRTHARFIQGTPLADERLYPRNIDPRAYATFQVGSDGTLAILDVGRVFFPDATLPADLRPLPTDEPVRLGGLTVTAIPVDHAAPHSRALLVETDGQRLLYTGDLRAHGRTGFRFEKLIADQRVSGVDWLLCEGTTLGSSGGSHGPSSEADVEERLLELARENPEKLTAVAASGQNLDRLLSCFRAARRPVAGWSSTLTRLTCSCGSRRSRGPSRRWAGTACASSSPTTRSSASRMPASWTSPAR